MLTPFRRQELVTLQQTGGCALEDGLEPGRVVAGSLADLPDRVVAAHVERVVAAQADLVWTEPVDQANRRGGMVRCNRTELTAPPRGR